jgi:ABC-type microcin C transport system permease subunit YejE
VGANESGRSVLALVLWGSRGSLVVGFAATLLSVVIAILASQRGAGPDNSGYLLAPLPAGR